MIYMYTKGKHDIHMYVISNFNLISIFKINYFNDIICVFNFSRTTAVKQYRYRCETCRQVIYLVSVLINLDSTYRKYYSHS